MIYDNRIYKERNEGYTAFLYGIVECPYRLAIKSDGQKNLDWWIGWHDAEEEDIQNHEEWR